MTTVIKGQPTSAEIRAKLAAEHRPVLVAYSLGKDAIAANLALRDAGIETVLAYMYGVPEMPFIEDTIHQQEDILQQPIHQYPHPSLYRWLNNLVYQPPERIQVIDAARLPDLTYSALWEVIKRDQNLPADTWIADGVRAADSIVRRASLSTHGIMKPSSTKVSPIADWLKREVLDCINSHHFPLPIDYEWFGRSFDGIDYRFLAPLKEHSPRDFAHLLEWFPLAEIGILRHEITA